mgnify:CR=1 FL=1
MIIFFVDQNLKNLPLSKILDIEKLNTILKTSDTKIYEGNFAHKLNNIDKIRRSVGFIGESDEIIEMLSAFEILISRFYKVHPTLSGTLIAINIPEVSPVDVLFSLLSNVIKASFKLRTTSLGFLEDFPKI